MKQDSFNIIAWVSGTALLPKSQVFRSNSGVKTVVSGHLKYDIDAEKKVYTA